MSLVVAWSIDRDLSHNDQYFNQKSSERSLIKFLEVFPHALISILGSKATIIQPIERTMLQRVGDVLFASRWETFDICICEPELADIETRFFNHRLEASNAQLHVGLGS